MLCTWQIYDKLTSFMNTKQMRLDTRRFCHSLLVNRMASLRPLPAPTWIRNHTTFAVAHDHMYKYKACIVDVTTSPKVSSAVLFLLPFRLELSHVRFANQSFETISPSWSWDNALVTNSTIQWNELQLLSVQWTIPRIKTVQHNRVVIYSGKLLEYSRTLTREHNVSI